jgi:phage tail protein X
MPITTIDTETTIDQLIAKRYGKLPAAKRKMLHAAILAANPQLDDAAELAPGMIVILPALAGGTAVRAVEGANPELIERIRGALAVYRDELGAKLKKRDSELAASMRTLESEQFRRLLEQVPGSPDYLESMRQGGKAEREELRLLHKFVDTELDKFIDELKLP